MTHADLSPQSDPQNRTQSESQFPHATDPCGHLHELSAFIDGELAPEVCAELEQHMMGCENCRVVVDTLRRTISLYRTLPADPELPPDVEERLWRRFDMEDLLPVSHMK